MPSDGKAMPFNPALMAIWSISIFIDPNGRAQPNNIGIFGRASRTVSKNPPMSLTDGGETPSMPVPVSGSKITSTSALSGYF